MPSTQPIAHAQPTPGKAHKRRKNINQPHTENKVGKGAYHKAHVSVAPAHRRVGVNFYIDHKIKRRHYANILGSRRHGKLNVLSLCHKQIYKRLGKNKTRRDKQRSNNGRNDKRRAEAPLYPFELVRAVILRHEIRKTACARCICTWCRKRQACCRR